MVISLLFYIHCLNFTKKKTHMLKSHFWWVTTKKNNSIKYLNW
jgi:hypothetical protein